MTTEVTDGPLDIKPNLPSQTVTGQCSDADVPNLQPFSDDFLAALTFHSLSFDWFVSQLNFMDV